MAWTDDRVEKLKKLWADGLSASQIATELGEVTRNAVIGKVHRLGLSGRAKSPATAKPRRPRTSSTPRPSGRSTVGNTALKTDYQPVAQPVASPRPMLVEEMEIPPEQRRSILTLTEQTCKWPVGDPTHDEFYFCGGVSEAGKPYCEHHSQVAYQPANERKRNRGR